VGYDSNRDGWQSVTIGIVTHKLKRDSQLVGVRGITHAVANRLRQK